MRKAVIVIVSGICFAVSTYMSIAAFRLAEHGALLFAGIGLVSGTFLLVSSRRLLIEKGIYKYVVADPHVSRRPASFVPHWFMMVVVLIFVFSVLAAIVIPIFARFFS